MKRLLGPLSSRAGCGLGASPLDGQATWSGSGGGPCSRHDGVLCISSRIRSMISLDDPPALRQMRTARRLRRSASVFPHAGASWSGHRPRRPRGDEVLLIAPSPVRAVQTRELQFGELVVVPRSSGREEPSVDGEQVPVALSPVGIGCGRHEGRALRHRPAIIGRTRS